ncbi:MAG: voltage-gated potassium channel [Mycobacterium sp.]|nr:voltage-gated potassium channel [Mycobacterium sp.]
MNTQTNLQRWERHAEWPLAAAALLFLGVYSVLVLTRPQGRESHVLWAVTWIIWGMFILDYAARLCLASDRARWFFRHLLLIYVASLAVFDKERYQSGATINSFGKAIWWSITTVTTVGYGDVYPVTNTGRVIAVLLMIGGISLVGVVTASLASWIIQSVAEEETASQAATAAHIDELRSEIRELAQEVRGRQ